MGVAPLIHQQPSPASRDHAVASSRGAPARQESRSGAPPLEAPEPGFGHDFGRVRVHEGEGGPSQRVTPGLLQRSMTLVGCDPAGSVEVTSKVSTLVGNSVTAISKAAAILSESPLAPWATSALREFFGAAGPGRAAEIADNLRKIATQLSNDTFTCLQPGTPEFDDQCNPKGEPPAIAVAHYGNDKYPPGISLCGSRALPSDLRFSETIVHEGAHRAFFATDKGYYDFNCGPTSETRRLGTEDLRWNADSYGCLVQRLASPMPAGFIGPLPPGP